MFTALRASSIVIPALTKDTTSLYFLSISRKLYVRLLRALIVHGAIGEEEGLEEVGEAEEVWGAEEVVGAEVDQGICRI